MLSRSLSRAGRSPQLFRSFRRFCQAYPGAPTACYVPVMEFKKEYEVRPIFRRLDPLGKRVDKNYETSLDPEALKKMYKAMVTVSEMDNFFNDAQRHGRISFYMQARGEEATHIGSASALKANDHIFAQYREVGVLMWRGFTLQQVAHQLFSNEHDLGKGRQMPVHYGYRAANFQTISSPLSTQIPQAAGAAYTLKNTDTCVICYFGEGAASEGDTHAALNFASTLDCPVIFFCRNNGYAISTPVIDQYRGDGIVSRAAGYGMASIRVDGNDLLAVHDATAAARKIAVEENRPVLIEAMTYRGGAHSTSDDPTRYRGTQEAAYWQEEMSAMSRTRLLLEDMGIWDSAQEVALREATVKEVRAALDNAEGCKKPAIEELFTDVYADVPQHLKYQMSSLQAHLAKHGDHYGLEGFASKQS